MDQRVIGLVALVVALAAAIVAGIALSRLSDVREGADRILREDDAEATGLRATVDAAEELARTAAAQTDALARDCKRLADRVASLEEAVAALGRQAQAPRRPGPNAQVVEVFRDDFEQGTQGWMVPPVVAGVTGTISHAKGKDVAKVGAGALRLDYPYEKGKVAVAVRVLIAPKGINRVRLLAKSTNGVAQIFVGATEADFSNYGIWTPLDAAQGWQEITVDFADMRLAPGSQDENNVLDLDQVMSLTVGDVGVFQGRKGKNALLIDDFRALRVGPAPQEDF